MKVVHTHAAVLKFNLICTTRTSSLADLFSHGAG